VVPDRSFDGEFNGIFPVLNECVLVEIRPDVPISLVFWGLGLVVEFPRGEENGSPYDR